MRSQDISWQRFNESFVQFSFISNSVVFNSNWDGRPFRSIARTATRICQRRKLYLKKHQIQQRNRYYG